VTGLKQSIFESTQFTGELNLMSQYIYILLNPAHKSLVKIGRTSRSPEERAQELSTATGVPLPFLVAYESLVSDSTRAEALIHEELSSQGYRTNPSREFFEVPLKVAVSIVDRICKSLPSCDDVPDEEMEPDESRSDWGYLAMGQDHMTGTGAILQDFVKARQCFEKAVSFGNSAAYIHLAEIHLWGLGVPKKSQEAIRLLQVGGKNGHHECYYNLWEVFAGRAFNSYSEDLERCDDVANHSNANVAFKWYLDAIKQANCSLETEKVMAYLDWVLKITPKGTKPLGTHTDQMIEALVDTVRQVISQMRSARISGLSIEKAVDELTKKPLRLKTMMEFKDLWERNSQNPSPFLKTMLVGCDVADLEFGFSRLPSHSLSKRVAEYTPFLPTAAANAEPQQIVAEPIQEAASTGTHIERKPTWLTRLFGK
jgi:hypothetical protein